LLVEIIKLPYCLIRWQAIHMKNIKVCQYPCHEVNNTSVNSYFVVMHSGIIIFDEISSHSAVLIDISSWLWVSASLFCISCVSFLRIRSAHPFPNQDTFHMTMIPADTIEKGYVTVKY